MTLDISTISTLTIIKTIHIFAVVIWVGGMFFAHLCLRPVVAQLLELPLRAQLWSPVFARFFLWVWIAIIALIVTGIWIIIIYGGMGGVRPHIHTMLGLGVVMMMVFMHIFFVPYRRLRQAVATQNFENTTRDLAQIRWLVTLNLFLGFMTIAITIIGRG